MALIKNYNPAFDFLKCIAAIMITNSHFRPLYEEHNPALATLGVHGNAIFFFVSGYFLYLSLKRRNYEIPFSEWYLKKIKQLWLPIIVLAFLAGFFNSDITWYDFMPTPWFVKCFLISFPIIFLIIKTRKSFILYLSFILSILFTICVVASYPPQSLSIFHKFHYYCYFPTMLLGVIIAKNKGFMNISLVQSLILTLISFFSYFVVMKIGKGHIDNSYYTQLFGYIPLLLFLVFLYKLAHFDWLKHFAETRCFIPVKIIARLTFEIYIVQRYIITDLFNSLFPFNTVVVFLLIVLGAYLVKISTNLFEQMVTGGNWDVKKAIVIL